MNDIRDDVAEIRKQVIATNGRVNGLEVEARITKAVEAERARNLARQAEERAEVLVADADAKARALVAQVDKRRWNVGTLLTLISVTCGLVAVLYSIFG
jgi:hypothetical protein